MRLLRWLASIHTEGYGGWSPTYPRLAAWIERRDAKKEQVEHEPFNTSNVLAFAITAAGICLAIIAILLNVRF